MHCDKNTVNKDTIPLMLSSRTAPRTARVMLTPAQLRAARGLLGWTLADLAKEAGVHKNSINAFEIEASDPKRSTLLALERALAKAGVVFIEPDKDGGPGVRLRS